MKQLLRFCILTVVAFLLQPNLAKAGCTINVYLDTTICAGEHIMVGTDMYDTTGSYTYHVFATTNCDTFFYTDLTVVPVVTPSVSIAAVAYRDITEPFISEFGPFTNNTYDKENQAKYAFDGDTTLFGWGANNGSPNDYLGFTYHTPVVLTSYGIYLSCDQNGGWCYDGYSPMNWTFEGRNGSTWVTLDSVAYDTLVIGTLKTFNFTNTTAYISYRINITATQQYNNYPHITEFYLAGADTITDLSYVTASDFYDPDNVPENAFDNDTLDYGWGNEGNGLPAWLAYDFEAGNAQVVNAYSIYNSCDQLGGWCDNEYNPMSWRFEATNNDTTWTTLDTIADAQLVIGTKSIFPISNTAAFRKYRLYVTYSSGNSYARITEMELLQGVAACNNNKFEASVANGGDSATLQWKVNGNNAGNGGYVESLANLSNGDVITCVLTANNKCQTTATATSSAVVYKADLISTVNATVCKDSFVVNGVPVSTGGTYTAVTAMASSCDSVVNYVLTVNDCSSVGINDSKPTEGRYLS
jgi:hypothetical protein